MVRSDIEKIDEARSDHLVADAGGDGVNAAQPGIQEGEVGIEVQRAAHQSQGVVGCTADAAAHIALVGV